MIVINNDDGITDGLIILAQVAKEFDDIFVCVPEKERSAASKAITLHKVLRHKKKIVDGIEINIISGTPNDAFLFSFYKYNYNKEKSIKLVLSGINKSSNVSMNVAFLSGTISICSEANFWGIPAIAFSKRRGFENLDEEQINNIKNTIRKVLKFFYSNQNAKTITLNINFPINVLSDKLVYAPVQKNAHLYEFVPGTDPRGRDYYWLVPGRVFIEKQGSDVDIVFNQNKTSISIIDFLSSVDSSNTNKMVNKLKEYLDQA